MTKLIDAIRAQHQHQRGENKRRAYPPLTDNLILEILIQQDDGRMGFEIAKDLNLTIQAVYKVMRDYRLLRTADGECKPIKNPHHDV